MSGAERRRERDHGLYDATSGASWLAMFRRLTELRRAREVEKRSRWQRMHAFFVALVLGTRADTLDDPPIGDPTRKLYGPEVPVCRCGRKYLPRPASVKPDELCRTCRGKAWARKEAKKQRKAEQAARAAQAARTKDRENVVEINRGEREISRSCSTPSR